MDELFFECSKILWSSFYGFSTGLCLPTNLFDSILVIISVCFNAYSWNLCPKIIIYSKIRLQLKIAIKINLYDEKKEIKITCYITLKLIELKNKSNRMLRHVNNR